MNRRDLLKGLAVGATAATLPVSLGVPRSAEAAIADPGNGPWWLLSPLQPGQEVAFGWYLGLFEANDRGALILNFHRAMPGEGGARSARVHVCYHDGRPKGVGRTELLDFILMDGGDGDAQTEESIARVVRHVAEIVRKNELREGAIDELARLLTHAERVERFGPETLV